MFVEFRVPEGNLVAVSPLHISCLIELDGRVEIRVGENELLEVQGTLEEVLEKLGMSANQSLEAELLREAMIGD